MINIHDNINQIYKISQGVKRQCDVKSVQAHLKKSLYDHPTHTYIHKLYIKIDDILNKELVGGGKRE
jgi:hypothetical protein